MIRGSKRQRPNGRWQFTAEVGRNPDGTRRQEFKTVGGAGRYDRLTEREAERELQLWLEKLETQGFSAPDKMTVAEYLGRWLDDQSVMRSINTARTSEMVARQWFIPHIGGIKLQELRAEHVQALLTAMKKGGLSASTIQTYRAHLASAMNRAVGLKLIGASPVSGTTITKPRKAQHTIWSLDDIKAFGQFVATLNEYRIYGQAALLAAQVGPRRGEIIALLREDYDARAGVLHIHRNSTEVHKAEGGVVFHDTKSELGVRDIQLPEPTKLLLREVLDQQEFQRKQRGYRDQGLMFAGPKGQPLQHSRVTGNFRSLVQRSGLPIITFHELRTSAATFMMDLGLDPTVVAYILGHDPRILMTIYRQVKSHQKEAAAEKLSAALALSTKGELNVISGSRNRGQHRQGARQQIPAKWQGDLELQRGCSGWQGAHRMVPLLGL